MSKINYRSDIDGLRAIAIISVLLFHLDSSYLSGGFVGVDIFFVISGFLITSIIKNEVETTGNFSFKNFYIRRVRRLFPALFVVSFFTTIFAALTLSPTHLSSFGGALASSFLSLSNFYFWVEADYFDVSSKLKPLLHTWSLSIEEQFYLIWPISLLLLLKIKNKSYIYLVLFLIVVMSFYMNDRFDDGSVSLINNYLPSLQEYIADGKSTIFFLLPFRLYEFIFGAVIVWLISYKLKHTYLYDILFVSGLLLIGYSVLFFTEELLFPSYYAVLPTLGAAFLIYSGAVSRFNIVLSNKLTVGLGLISYSLYLIHWPMIVFWNYLASTTIYQNIFIAIASIVLAFLSYKYIEQPFRKKRFDLATSYWKYSSVAAFAIMGYIGINMYTYNGWEWRMKSPVVFENVGDSKNFHKKFYGGEGYPYKGAVYTDKPADIVVIGDSHARHYMEGLYEVLAKPNNLNLYNNSGMSCIMLPFFTRTTEGQNWDKMCPNALNEGLKYLQQGDQNSILIISESWVTQMEYADLLDEQGNRRNIKITAKEVSNAIIELKSKIGNRTLIVIGQVPGAEDNLYDIFTRPRPIFFGNDTDKYITSEPREDFIRFNDYLKKVALQTNKFIFLNPFDVLCKNNVCKNLNEQKHLIYSDKNHLSKYGSVEVINGFMPELKNILLKGHVKIEQFNN